MKPERKLRVLVVAPSGGVHGGVEAFSLQIARELLSSGLFEVRVVFRLMKGWKANPRFVAAITKLPFSCQMFMGVNLVILRHIWWSDLINCHFPMMDVTFPSRAMGKKLVISVENRRLNSHRIFHDWGLRLAHRRWYISQFVSSTWEGNGLQPGSAIVPAVSEFSAFETEPTNRRGFIFIARWVPHKGLQELISAYEKARINHHTHPLVLVGEGPLKTGILQIIFASPVREHISVKGFVSPGEKSMLLSQARWNAAPATFEEDLGLTPIEARACGVPSIVSDIGGLPEAGGPSAMLCKPGDITDLARCIEAAAGMPEEEYKRRSQLARSSLSTYLPPEDFYSTEFRSLLKHEFNPI